MFLLADCNNFFASCEMVFNPKLEQKPLVILSNNDGMIIARSPKAKALGVQMGDPAYLYKNRADIIMLSANFVLYSDMSQRVMQTLAKFSPDIEIYSIDEAFLELEDRADLDGFCKEIRQTVKQWTGIPVSIGAAPTKTLAKLASEWAKKAGGVFVFRNNEIEERLAQTELKEVWGIGEGLSDRLKRKGIYTALQLIQADDVWIQKQLGVTGFRTVLELRGTPVFELSEEPEKKKSIVCSRSFGQKVTELSLLEEAVASFAARAAEKLRDQMSLTSFLSVFTESGSCHVHIPNATSYTPELITLAKEGVRRLFRQGAEYRKAGVMLGDFTEDRQGDFLTPAKSDKGEAMKVMDAINARYDRPKVQFAAEGIKRPWKSRRSNCSPKFTTSWNELVKV
ncbi:MAG: Y-family DNA polymerase [Parachlamydiales bacterium]|nr:Y-family DNA polymerase [Parachlamydiales bacterium]